MKIDKTKSRRLRLNHSRAGRWFEQPKKEHKIVLEATEIANKAFERVVTVGEVIQALLPKDLKLLKQTYSRDNFNTTISAILRLLKKRGLVFCVNQSKHRNYYGVVGIVDSEDININTLKSRRQKTLALVKTAVLETGKAMKMREISRFAMTHPSFENLNSTHIAQDVLSLKQTGEIIFVSTIRGDKNGTKLYLPAEFKVEDYLPKDSVSWLEYVFEVFIELWEKHKSDRKESGKLPLPVTTGEVRSKILALGNFSEKLENPKTLISAMQQLTKTNTPNIKSIKRKGQKAILWVPIEVKEYEVDLEESYAHDTERIEEAIKRASSRLGRPVNIKDITAEINTDLSLQPISKKNYYILTADSARDLLASSEGRKKRVSPKVHRVGVLSGQAYFYPENVREAFAFVEYKILEKEWINLNPLKEINNIETCMLNTVALGRLKLLKQQLVKIRNELKELANLKKILGIENTELRRFIDELTEVLQRVKHELKGFINENNLLPKIVKNTVTGLTVNELKLLLAPYYPRIAQLADGQPLQGYLKDSIRRLPNPDFKFTNSQNPRQAVRYFYDRTDALLYIAKEWGGEESRLQATLAGNELGLLRDAMFVIESIYDLEFNEKLTAISCLAFLPSKEGNKILKHISKFDSEYGIRQSSLWAYGLAKDADKEAMDFIMEQSFHDADKRVREFARNLLENGKKGWLFM